MAASHDPAVVAPVADAFAGFFTPAGPGNSSDATAHLAELPTPAACCVHPAGQVTAPDDPK